jgi:hypothetical protein
MIWVDLPVQGEYGEFEYKHVQDFRTTEEALKWLRDRGLDVDQCGRVGLISGSDEEEDSDGEYQT